MNVVENLLVTLMEECSEVAKAASKILRAGPDHVPPGRTTTNLEELNTELNDLIGVLLELAANGVPVATRNLEAVGKKRLKLRHFISVSRELGCVQGPLAYMERDNPFTDTPVFQDPELERRRAPSVSPKPGLLVASGGELDYYAEQQGANKRLPDETDAAFRIRLLQQDTNPQEWRKHDGGPCPVRHEEVEVFTRSMWSENTLDFATSVPRKGMPENFNWHWGVPGSATTPIDVLRWRKVL